MIDESLQILLGGAISEKLQVKIHINEAKSVNGGDINKTFRIGTNEGYFFLKLNNAVLYPDLFQQEYAGLTELRNAQALAVPKPLAYGEAAGKSFLLLENITKGTAIGDFWENFAAGLSKQHLRTKPHFGYVSPNYIGTLKQYNTPYSSWPVFYAFNRLMPLTKLAYDKGIIEAATVKQMERLCKQLPQIFPAEKPALLHGDLWSGNFMIGPDGRACVYDPSVYYGHREVDLAMTRLFGGFDTRFYYAYQSIYPLAPGWQQRIGVCQLYPLLVHTILFGGSYYGSVKEVLAAY
ncbi:Fructosamine-3-kinase [Chitinophaga jiangningensis]|uniref:Fructosamine-3-kinase n=1 Tax=Chitinophaga jiangningensis TaxID=1419482 RepID=A0A1M6YR62_9BACT|nr:fructosamine kinase family protein [Chitinophaga jiangningensis]SHL20585.1 Fructosamine-3-kinase [Chitinophaga jiangningensis]